MNLSLHTTHLDHLVRRHQQQDAAAFEELLHLCFDRIDKLARKMLANYPLVAQQEETGDVLNSALLRLRKALLSVGPVSTREFFCLAAEQIRRELLDRLRYYQRRPKLSPVSRPDELGVVESDARELDRWTAFHDAIAELPVRERETFSLVFYQGWQRAEIAEIFGVSVRQVGRWWAQACLLLHERLQGEIPT